MAGRGKLVSVRMASFHNNVKVSLIGVAVRASLVYIFIQDNTMEDKPAIILGDPELGLGFIIPYFLAVYAGWYS